MIRQACCVSRLGNWCSSCWVVLEPRLSVDLYGFPKMVTFPLLFPMFWLHAPRPHEKKKKKMTFIYVSLSSFLREIPSFGSCTFSAYDRRSQMIFDGKPKLGQTIRNQPFTTTSKNTRRKLVFLGVLPSEMVIWTKVLISSHRTTKPMTWQSDPKVAKTATKRSVAWSVLTWGVQSAFLWAKRH